MNRTEQLLRRDLGIKNDEFSIPLISVVKHEHNCLEGLFSSVSICG